MTAFHSLQASAIAFLAGLCACSGAAPVEAETQAAEARTGLAQGSSAIPSIAQAARPLTGSGSDHSDLLAATQGASRILLGESTHGTSEFYRERGRLTERLIREQGVNAVAIEGDWSPGWRVNQYVRGVGADRSAAEALSGFTNFPQWMWPNTDFAAFVERLRALNLERPEEQRVGLYGMDVYDLFDAADAVVTYLRERHPTAAAAAERRYRCFRPYRRSNQAYGEATLGGRNTCREQAEAVAQSVRALPRPSDRSEAEAHFAAVRAASSVQAGEEYFRIAYGGTLSWNARDRWMARNVDEIAAHAEAQTGRPGKVVVWSHNSHTGDARATDMVNRGELNLGQLMRERHGDRAFLVGFLAYGGTVFAAPQWDAPGRVYDMKPALAGSHAALLHQVGMPAFSLVLRGNASLQRLLGAPMEQRAIGVVYAPHQERISHYVRANLARQFDALVFFQRSTAVTPLGRQAGQVSR
jgi:erythromycin esterase-like protein